MTARARAPKASRAPGKAHPFYARLHELGCTFCRECFAYTWPDHAHADFTADRHASRYVIVGGFGSVRLVDLAAESEPVESIECVDETAAAEVLA